MLTKKDINQIKKEIIRRTAYLHEYTQLKRKADIMRLESKKYTHRAIAKRFNVSAATIQQIADGNRG
jgi:hypothetical protein